MRRLTILILAMAMLAVPTSALALDDTATDTDRSDVATTDVDRDTDSRRTFERAKERAQQRIEGLLRVLDGLGDEVAGSRFVTGAHAGALRADFARASAGLENLARQIETAATWEELGGLVDQIDDYAVTQVIAPKTHQVIASDALVAASRRLEVFAGTLEWAIERFELAGFDVEEAQRLLAEMDGEIAAGLRLADPVAEAVIDLDGSEWPDPAQGILAQGRTDLKAAAGHLRTARRTGVEIVQYLRALMDA